MNTRVKLGGWEQNGAGEMESLAVSIWTKLLPAKVQAASLDDVKRSEVNQFQFGMPTECLLVISIFPNEKKQETLQTSGAFPNDNFNSPEIQFLI